MKKVLLALAVVALLSGVMLSASVASASGTGTMQVYTLANNGATVAVTQGQMFEVNLGTGYIWRWKVVHPRIPQSPVLRLVSFHQGNAVGTNPTPTIGTAVAIGPGTSTIVAIGTPACGCGAAKQRFVLHVTVTGPSTQ